MKKNIIMKGVLLLIILAILSIVFAGCSPIIIIPTTGTVYITVNVPDYYDIYVDGVFQGTTNGNGNFTLTGVPTGSHIFEADGYYYGYSYYGYWWWYEGTKSQTIYAYSTNNVTIPVTLYYN